MTTIRYIKDVDISDVLDFTIDNLNELSHFLDAAQNTVAGLRSSSLQNDPKSALIAAELVATVRSAASAVVDRLVVDLMVSHEPHRPPVNEIARAAGVSVTRAKGLLMNAEEIPELDEDGHPITAA